MIRSRIRNWERGQSLIEMALSTILLLFVLGGMVDFGRAFMILVATENAAGEGALYAAQNPGCLTLYDADGTNDTTNTNCSNQQGAYSGAGSIIEERIYQEGNAFANFNDGNTVITITIEGTGIVTAGNPVLVEVEYTYTPLTPAGLIIWGSTATVSAEARQPVFSPPPTGY